MQSERRFRFSQKSIKALPVPESGSVQYYDTATPGLGLRLSKTGRISWTYASPSERVTLPVNDLESARRLALRKAAAGSAARAEADDWTLGNLFSLWIEKHAKPRKRTWKRDVARFDSYLADWRERRLDSITRVDVLELHNRLGAEAGHYSANDTLAFLASLYQFAERFDYSGKNPARGIERFPEQSRERYLLPEEFPRWHAAVMKLSVSEARDFFLLALWTGVRRQTVLSMRWDEIDIEAGVWLIPAEKEKTKRDVIVYLSEEAREVLKRRKSHAESEYVLPSPGGSKSGHYTEPKAAWRKVCEEAGLSDLRIHDLRRTLGSWMAEGGASLQIIGKALGHSSTSATAIYSRLGSGAVRGAVNSAIDRMKATLKTQSEEKPQSI